MDIFPPLYDQWHTAGSNTSSKAASQDLKLHSSSNGKDTKLSDSDGSDEEKPAFFVFGDSKGGISKFLQLSAKIGKTKGAEQGSLVSQLAESLAGVTITPDQSYKVAESLATALTPSFLGKMSNTGLERERETWEPVFSLFHPLNTKEDAGSLLPVIVFLNSLESRIGSFLLYYLTSLDTSNQDKLSIYTSFCKARNLDYEAGLVSDLRCCQNEDVSLLIMLVPRLYDILPDMFLGNSELIYIVVSSVDSQQLLYLTSLILVQRLVLLVPHSCLSVLQASLTWETFEQLMFWQIYSAHHLPLHILFQFVPSLQYKIHAEALTSVLLIFKKAEPSQDLMKCLFQRKPHKEDRFLTSLLLHWTNADQEKLSEVLLVFLAKHVKLTNSPLRGNILAHSPIMVEQCKHIFLQPNLVKCFTKLKMSCNEKELQTYSDVFSSLEDMQVVTKDTRKRKRMSGKCSDEDVARKSARKKSNNADELT